METIITLAHLNKIESKPDINYIKNKKHKTTRKSRIYGVIVEKRYPKVVTDENKLFDTKPNHKYFN